MKIYLPITLNNQNCVEIRDKDTIRVWERQPYQNGTFNYTDYYINSHYLEKAGTSTFSQYSTIPICVDHSTITNDYFYRNDIADICITFTILCIFVFLIPLKVFMRFFRRVRL